MLWSLWIIYIFISWKVWNKNRHIFFVLKILSLHGSTFVKTALTSAVMFKLLWRDAHFNFAKGATLHRYVTATYIHFKTCIWVCKYFTFLKILFSAHPNEKCAWKKLFCKMFETNSYFSIYGYFPHFLNSERKLPPVTFHPYSYGETFWLGTVTLLWKRTK